MALWEALDLVLEVRDARAPLLTMSPVAAGFPDSTAVWVILSKADLADPDVTSEWIRHFKERGRSAWALDLRHNLPEGLKKAISALAPSSSSKSVYREARVAVVGTPNVGKSMFLNRLVGRHAAVVGGVPGVTKGVSWFKCPGCLVADSPGILDPHSDARVHRMMSWISSTKGQIIGSWDDLARECIEFLQNRGMNRVISGAWGIETSGTSNEVLERLGHRLGKLMPGGGVDLEASGRAFIGALSDGRLGRVSLERPGKPVFSEVIR
ncbi:MAG: 50S ribosome-binding GTPase [Synergistaceae bacterium]|nr:50S ribosome-binding GTPase [Synergistaceae bacterium]